MCNKILIGVRLDGRETYHQSFSYYTSSRWRALDREQQAPISLSNHTHYSTPRSKNTHSEEGFDTPLVVEHTLLWLLVNNWRIQKCIKTSTILSFEKKLMYSGKFIYKNSGEDILSNWIIGLKEKNLHTLDSQVICFSSFHIFRLSRDVLKCYDEPQDYVNNFLWHASLIYFMDWLVDISVT